MNLHETLKKKKKKKKGPVLIQVLIQTRYQIKTHLQSNS